jgi:hypothetical protein
MSKMRDDLIRREPEETMQWNVFNARRERRRARAEAPGQHEDNLSRALFITWRALSKQGHLSKALRPLGQSRRYQKIVDLIEAGGKRVELGTQGLPPLTDQALRAIPNRMVVGISSSRITGAWSHDKRTWPECIRPDGWIHLPGEALLVFEAKTADHALDTTQVLAYCAHLGLVEQLSDFPYPDRDECLSLEAAGHYKCKLVPWVEDANWDAAQQGIHAAARLELSPVARFLVEQCGAYLEDNRFVPWGQGCFAQLGQLDSPRRKDNGRILLGRLSKELDLPGYKVKTHLTPVAAPKGQVPQDWRAPLGASNYPYLGWAGPVVNTNLGSSSFYCLNLGEDGCLFSFEIYIEAPGANTPLRARNLVGDDEVVDRELSEKWAASRQRHLSKGHKWFEAVTSLPGHLEIRIGAVKYKGLNVLWRGSERAHDPAPVKMRVADLRRQGWAAVEPFWRFEEARAGITMGELRHLAFRIRKAAISVKEVPKGTEAPSAADLDAAFKRLGSLVKA